ncbi:hypothetical protein ABC255_09570 [Neobacillus sp. 3P2-tot-E-2]|uniref:hypothetical protein n=1 Tax=Neobacillus sp. 3P2-tot-E-2 TaxID=3132212 RepID=UPI0039A10DFE
MEIFDNVFDALREVKRLSNNLERTFEKIYFVYNEYYENYIVADDNYDVSKAIHQRWCDSGCDSEPENEAKEYKIWEYSLAENKEKYPHSYRSAKRSLIKSKVPLIRKPKEIECEYSVSFNI